jgi:hypothetical protein
MKPSSARKKLFIATVPVAVLVAAIVVVWRQMAAESISRSLDALSDPNSDVRDEAVWALYDMNRPDIVRELIRRLEARDNAGEAAYAVLMLRVYQPGAYRYWTTSQPQGGSGLRRALNRQEAEILEKQRELMVLDDLLPKLAQVDAVRDKLEADLQGEDAWQREGAIGALSWYPVEYAIAVCLDVLQAPDRPGFDEALHKLCELQRAGELPAADYPAICQTLDENLRRAASTLGSFDLDAAAGLGSMEALKILAERAGSRTNRAMKRATYRGLVERLLPDVDLTDRDLTEWLAENKSRIVFDLRQRRFVLKEDEEAAIE